MTDCIVEIKVIGLLTFHSAFICCRHVVQLLSRLDPEAVLEDSSGDEVSLHLL